MPEGAQRPGGEVAAAANPRRRSRALATLALLAVLLSLPVLYAAWRARMDLAGPVRDAQLQLAGGYARACDVIDGAADGTCRARDDRVALYAAAVRASWWFLAGSTLLLLGVFGAGALYLHGSGARRIAFWCLLGAVAVFVVDAGENVLLGVGLEQFGPARDPAFQWAASASVVKFAIFGPLLPVLAVVGPVLLGRRIAGKRLLVVEDGERPVVDASDLDGLDPDARPHVVLPPAVADTSTATLSATVQQPASDVEEVLHTKTGRDQAIEAAGERAVQGTQASRLEPAQSRWRNAGRVPPGRRPAGVGISASGGGIRSACVTLGALQALRAEKVLQRARYLVSVSGGGYAVGAFQLALTQQPGAESLATAEDVFTPGSPEEHHLRRHGRYIADGIREWITALGVVLRGVAASLGLLTLVVVVAGVALNVFYRAAPVVGITRLLPRFDPLNVHAAKARGGRFPEWPGFPTPPAYVWWTLAIGAAIAVLAWVGVMLALLLSAGSAWARRFRVAFRAVVSVTAVIAAYAVVMPTIIWAMARLTWAVPVKSPLSATSLAAVLTTLLTWFGTLVSTGWRRVEKVTTSGEKVGGLRGLFGRKDQVVEQQVATGFTQRLIVWVVLAVLALVFTFILSWTAASAHRWHELLGPALLAVLVAAGFLIDQTWLGLHPFYRRRLASAFAVRRAHMVDGGIGALPYRFEEGTPLCAYGRRPDRFPQVIFSSAAALSGQSRTPPGRRAVSFSFSTDYVGGPDVGWVRTDTLEATCTPSLRRDVTVQAAMAVSGAAFASAMGRQASAIQTLLALSNVRLGTWLPNPGFLATLAREREGDEWTTPRLPRARRLPYQLREVVGAYPAEGRMLLCTDGGHYENLGLVELLRHRCRTVYTIDASGDSPPLATTLAEAITLASEELGVTIALEGADGLVPGSATPLEPAEVFERLNVRLSKCAVVRGRIEYPEEVDFGDGEPPSRHGTLVVAKALLTSDMPYEILSYALKEPVFPRQSTSDQFFDHEQFDAYVALGYQIGARAAKAAAEHDDEPSAWQRLRRRWRDGLS